MPAEPNLERMVQSPVRSPLREQLRDAAGMGIWAAAFAVHEVGQQIKHGYFHVRGIPHRRECEDPEFSFPYYERVYH